MKNLILKRPFLTLGQNLLPCISWNKFNPSPTQVFEMPFNILSFSIFQVRHPYFSLAFLTCHDGESVYHPGCCSATKRPLFPQSQYLNQPTEFNCLSISVTGQNAQRSQEWYRYLLKMKTRHHCSVRLISCH